MADVWKDVKGMRLEHMTSSTSAVLSQRSCYNWWRGRPLHTLTPGLSPPEVQEDMGLQFTVMSLSAQNI